jgi:dienelactone hydrolase
MRLKPHRLRLALAIVLILFALPAQAETFIREDIRIPMAQAGARGLEAVLVRPDAPGQYPLALISHGAPRDGAARAKMSPGSSYPLALEFARRGFAALIVMRRGYGDSGGAYAESAGQCDSPDYVASAQASAHDLKAAIAWAGHRNDIDTGRMIAVGRSAGGLATVALTANPPPGLVAAISFAGGRGSRADYVVCKEARLVAAFGQLGKTSRVPMLWVYSENDHYFAPALAERFHAAFVASGGQARFIKAATFGQDGHNLFSLDGIPIWTDYVDNFLSAQHLTLRSAPAGLPTLPPAPAQLSQNGRHAFENYSRSGQHKAFAVTADGHFGWATGKRTVDEAETTALKFCEGANGRDCHIVFVDDEAVP